MPIRVGPGRFGRYEPPDVAGPQRPVVLRNLVSARSWPETRRRDSGSRPYPLHPYRCNGHWSCFGIPGNVGLIRVEGTVTATCGADRPDRPNPAKISHRSTLTEPRTVTSIEGPSRHPIRLSPTRADVLTIPEYPPGPSRAEPRRADFTPVGPEPRRRSWPDADDRSSPESHGGVDTLHAPNWTKVIVPG